MAVIFPARPGSVVRLDDPALQCQARFFDMPDPEFGFQTERSIVTRLTVSQQVNVQFLHTLGSAIYVYVFGDRVGQVGLSGLSFACGCAGDDDAGHNGAELAYLWYLKHRASKRKAPIRIMLGNTPIEGFVTGVTEDVVDPSLRLVQWGLNLTVIPDEG